MGETKRINSLLLVKDKNEIDFFNESKISEFCISESDKILKELKINEIELNYHDFRELLKAFIFDLKNSIYITSNLENQILKKINTTLINLRDRIDSHFRNNFSDIIDWHKPNPIDKLFRKNIPSENNFSTFLKKQNIIKENNGFIAYNNLENSNLKNTIKDFDKDIFKDYDTYNKFLEYQKSNTDFIPDYSYIFQKLLSLDLIHKKKHKEYKEWLLINKFITKTQYEMFIDRGSFDSLKNLDRGKRKKHFDNIFGENEKS